MSLRVLAIDDESEILSVWRRAFTAAGHEVTAASSAGDGLDLARRRYFDLAVVDYDMPAMNGLEFLERLKAIQPGCPGILASGHLDVPVMIAAINRGEISRVLEKPFKATELVAAAEEVIEARRQLARLPDLDGRAWEEREALAEVLEGDYLRLAFQPIVDAQTAQPVAYEALLRSSHPLLRGPLEVLAAAETHGKLDAVAALVVQRARDWLIATPEHLGLFLNLHPRELANPEGLAARVEPLRPWAHRLVFEITERSRVLDFGAWATSTAVLRDMGAQLAVDDLGAGYSSLSVLAELKPAFIKVDMSIVRNIHKDTHKRRLVELLGEFSRATDAVLIAEGVEIVEEAGAVREAGAHLLQGYHFGKPALWTLQMDVPPPVARDAGAARVGDSL